VSRSVAAFLIAPLWVPLIVVPYTLFVIFPYPAQHLWVAVAGLLSTVFTYLGVGLIGLPVFRFLRSRNWTVIWIASVAGFVIGSAMWLVFTVIFILSLGESFSGVASATQDWRNQAAFLWLPGALGTLVGLTLWAIARPDRGA
jgi:hypothetical protein